jgi:uncharacterized membrane protein YidH (DUF202 family)
MKDSHADGLWDVGLQPERTSLAWLRTCLGLAGGALLTARVFLATESWAALGILVIVIAAAAGLVWWGAHRRARLATDSLRRTSHLADGPGGRLLLLTSVCACAVAVANAALTLVIPSL